MPKTEYKIQANQPSEAGSVTQMDGLYKVSVDRQRVRTDPDAQQRETKHRHDVLQTNQTVRIVSSERRPHQPPYLLDRRMYWHLPAHATR